MKRSYDFVIVVEVLIKMFVLLNYTRNGLPTSVSVFVSVHNPLAKEKTEFQFLNTGSVLDRLHGS